MAAPGDVRQLCHLRDKFSAPMLGADVRRNMKKSGESRHAVRGDLVLALAACFWAVSSGASFLGQARAHSVQHASNC